MTVNTLTVESANNNSSEKGKQNNFYSPRAQNNGKGHPIVVIEEEVKGEEITSKDRSSIISNVSANHNNDHHPKKDTTNKITHTPQQSEMKKFNTQTGPQQSKSLATQNNNLRPPTKLLQSQTSKVSHSNLTTMNTTNNTTINYSKTQTNQQEPQKPQVKSQVTHQTKIQDKPVTNTNNNDEDEFIDDMLDDSMELHETNTNMGSLLNRQKTNDSTRDSNANTNKSIYQSTPSKLNSKFSHTNTTKTPVVGGGTAKYQNVKTSAIQGKKSLQSMQENNKPMAQLEFNQPMNNIITIPIESITNINLRAIDLKQNKITELPDQLFQLPNLWKLQLDNNSISLLPDLFSGLPALKIFTISYNQIEQLPQSLYTLKQIEKIDVSMNKITEISKDIGNLTTLKFLFISNNNIGHLPTSLQNFSNLQQIGIDWCQYLKPNYDKIIKKQITQNQQIDDSLISNFLKTFGQFQQESISFFEFLQKFYSSKNIGHTLNKLQIQKGQNVMHLICKYNHYYLYETLKEQKKYIDINIQDEYGQTPLIAALNEQSLQLVDKFLRDFKETIEFTNDYQYPNEDLSPGKQSLVLHPLMLAVKKQMLDTALRILSIMIKQHQKNQTVLDLNIKDDNKNTLFHHLFQNFSTNMELSVELCQELLKQSERGNRNIPPTVVLKLNEINKQGMTPLDLAVEVKQNQALEFAIYYNKNMLPALQTKNTKHRELFDLSFNSNQRGLTPLHRAIACNNYKAIYLLLQSGDCNLLLKDKEFKSPRDYCQKILFLSKYLRKGELNYMNFILEKLHEERIRNKFDPKVYLSQPQPQQKQMVHNHINFYVMSKRQNRVKYNSWYTRLEQRNNMFNSSQQPTLEQKDEQSDDEAIKIEDIKDDEESENINEENHSHLGMHQSLINSNLTQEEKLRIRPHDKLSNTNLGEEYGQMSERRLSGNNKRSKPNNGNIQRASFLSSPSLQQKAKNIQSQQSTIDNQSRPITQGNIMGMNTSGFDMIKSSFEKNFTKNMPNEDPLPDNFDDMHDGSQDAIEESPSTLPSKQFKYVLSINNSKLARKPYYKQLQKNKFEREFCLILDQRIPLSEKILYFYQVFAKVQQNKEEDLKDGRDFAAFLKLEIDQKENDIESLKNELSYFQDFLLQSQQTTTQQTKKKNFSLERGPLPMIKEASLEINAIKVTQVNAAALTSRKSTLKNVNSKDSNRNLNGLQVSGFSYEEERNTLKITSSQKSLDVYNVKQQYKKQATKEEEKTLSLKVVPIGLSDYYSQESQRSPQSPRIKPQQSKTPGNLTNTFVFQTPQPNISSTQQNQHSQQKSKDSCIKKIEVQITAAEPLTQHQSQTPNIGATDKNKWKQLTINPNAAPGSNIGKGLQKPQGQTQKTTLTPQSQKGTPQAAQIVTVQTGMVNQSITSQTTTTTTTQAKITIVQANNQKTSSSLSNRSTSNPRNSLLGSSGASNFSKKGDTKTTSSVAKPQQKTQPQQQLPNSIQTVQQTANGGNAGTTNHFSQTQSKLKAPSKHLLPKEMEQTYEALKVILDDEETFTHVCNEVFKTIDLDQSGYIERQEIKNFIVGICSDLGMKESPDEKAIQEVFLELDQDNSNDISNEELKGFLRKLFITQKDEVARALGRK